jgi:hypothetical protein
MAAENTLLNHLVDSLCDFLIEIVCGSRARILISFAPGSNL